MELTHAVSIAAPPPVVWSTWTDVARWPEWTASVTSVEVADSGAREAGAEPDQRRLVVGTRARIRQPKLPVATWRVTAVDDGSAFTWVSISLGSRVTGRHRVQEASGGGTVATMSISFEGPLGRIAGVYWRRLTLAYMRIEGEGLRSRCESGAGQF